MLSNRTRHCCSMASSCTPTLQLSCDKNRVEVVDLFGPMLSDDLARCSSMLCLNCIWGRGTQALSQRPPTAPRLVLLRVLLLPLIDCYNRESEDVQ